MLIVYTQILLEKKEIRIIQSGKGHRWKRTGGCRWWIFSSQKVTNSNKFLTVTPFPVQSPLDKDSPCGFWTYAHTPLLSVWIIMRTDVYILAYILAFLALWFLSPASLHHSSLSCCFLPFTPSCDKIPEMQQILEQYHEMNDVQWYMCIYVHNWIIWTEHNCNENFFFLLHLTRYTF